MKLTLTLLSLTLCASLSAQKGVVLCKWTEDGSTEKSIPADAYTFFKKGNLYYSFSNDNTNIYVDIKIEDSGVETRILKEGLVLWINSDNKADKKMGVHFPIGSQNARRRPGTPEPKFNADGTPITPFSQANTIELIGFTSEQQRRFPADNPDSFKGSVKYDNDGILHYKLVMPIEKLPVRNAKEGTGAMPFTLGIVYGIDPELAELANAGNARPAGAGAPAGGGGGGQRAGGGGAGGGGGRPGGGGGGAAGGGMDQPEVEPPVVLWVKSVQLAVKQ
jgi:hypothetical protein